jgi:hypothetical protein
MHEETLHMRASLFYRADLFDRAVGIRTGAIDERIRIIDRFCHALQLETGANTTDHGHIEMDFGRFILTADDAFQSTALAKRPTERTVARR